MAEINLKLDVQEAQALMTLIDIAVKTSGLQVAEAGVVLSRKLREAAQPKAPEAPKAKKEKKDAVAE